MKSASGATTTASTTESYPEEETFQGYLHKFGFRQRREAVQAQIEIRKKRISTQRVQIHENRMEKLRKRMKKEEEDDFKRLTDVTPE